MMRNEILETACNYYCDNLYLNKNALDYLEHRGINNSSILANNIGYCNGGTFKYLNSIGITGNDIVLSGLVNSSHDDLFKGYITVPIIDSFNRTVFITSRNLDSKDELKHKHIYGNIGEFFFLEKNVFNKAPILILSESWTDTLVLNQDGFNTVSVLGTNGYSLSRVEKLSLSNKKIYFMFDSDKNNAGYNGALNFANVLLSNKNIDSSIVTFPPYKSKENVIQYYDINDVYMSFKKMKTIEFFIKNRKVIFNSFKNFINFLFETENDPRYRSIYKYSDTKHYSEYKKHQEYLKSKKVAHNNGTFSDKIRLIKEIPLEKVIGSFIKVSKNGRYYRAVCPFHVDTDPSLVIYKSSNTFTCFGCGIKGRDSIYFIQKYLNLNFSEALEYLNTNFLMSHV